jgi:imidazolonepropionase-like amidohydrolase
MLSGEPPVMPEPIVRVVRTAQEAAAAVDAYAEAGYDFVKVRDNLGAGVLRAVMTAAARRGLEVDGHLPRDGEPIGEARRGVAHVDELALRVEDEARDPAEFARRLRACGCYVTTTLSIEKNVAAQLRDYDALAARPAMRYVHPLLRDALWEREKNPYLAEGQDPRFFDELLRIDALVVRALAEAGVPLLAGTDALVPMMIPGESLHGELELLQAAGLSRFEALRAATFAPSQVFPRFGDLGLVAPGRAANLVLVRGNPLTDLGVLRRPEAVIVEGEYLDRAAIEDRLAKIADRFAREAGP